MKWMAPASGIEVCHVGCCEYSQQEEPSISSVALHRLDLKSFGQRIAARDPDCQTAEIHISVILRLSRTHGVRLLIHESLQCPRHRQDHPRGMNLRGKGPSRHRPELRNNAHLLRRYILGWMKHTNQ